MITLLKDVAAIGTGEDFVVIKDQDEVNAWASVQVEFTGSPTALTITIECSVTGNLFQCLATHELTAEELAAGTAIFHVINKAAPIVRAVVDVLTGGVSPEVSIYYNKGIS